MSNINLVDLVAERIKTTPVGQLIKEEDLYEVVKQGMEKAFFAPRVDNSGYHRKESPPLIVEELRKVMFEALKPQIEKWVLVNGDVLLAKLQEVMTADIHRASEEILAAKAREAMRPALTAMMDAINQERQAANLPPLAVYF